MGGGEFLAAPGVLSSASGQVDGAGGTAASTDPATGFTGATVGLPGAVSASALRGAGARLDSAVTGWGHEVSSYGTALDTSSVEYNRGDATSRAHLSGANPKLGTPGAAGGRVAV